MQDWLSQYIKQIFSCLAQDLLSVPENLLPFDEALKMAIRLSCPLGQVNKVTSYRKITQLSGNGNVAGIGELHTIMGGIGRAQMSAQTIIQRCKVNICKSSGVKEHTAALDDLNGLMFDWEPKYNECELISEAVIRDLELKLTVCSDIQFKEALQALSGTFENNFIKMQTFHKIL